MSLACPSTRMGVNVALRGVATKKAKLCADVAQSPAGRRSAGTRCQSNGPLCCTRERSPINDVLT